MAKEDTNMKISNPIPKLLLLSLSSVLMACSLNTSSNGSTATSVTKASDSSTTNSQASSTASVSQPSVSLSSVSVEETGDTSGLTITTTDGTYTASGSTVNITAAGTYTLSGELNGMIYVDAGDDDEVILELAGLTIENSSNSPIYVNNASEVKIKAKKNTENFISDTRSLKTVDDETQGEGAIYSACDLKLSGTGSLTVVANYNHGIHSNDDVEIKNQTLTVSSPNHAVKGKDSITVEEGGTFVFVSTGGDGLHTENSDLSSKGNQRGDITITGGNVSIYSGTDGIDASHDVIISGGLDSDGLTTTPEITIYTNSYSSYTGDIIELTNEVISSQGTVSYLNPGPGGGTRPGGGTQPGGNPWGGNTSSSSSSSVSSKGIKAENKIDISNGTIVIKAYDDAIHANYGTTLENGSVGQGDVNISGGNLNLTSSDDGIHADRYLNVSGGTLYVSAYEGYEGNQITISGGYSYVYGNDDGVNATSGPLSETYFKVTNGYIFVEVSSNGDVDGVDSNGNVYIQGGTCIACGPNQMMAAALDYEGRASVTGGSLILFGMAEATPSTSGVTSSRSSASVTAGSTYKITFSNGNVTTGQFKYAHSGNVYAWSALGSISSIAKS